MPYFIALAIALCSWIQVPEGDWEPTAAQAAELRHALKPYVDAQAIDWREDLAPWERYTVQYQGQLRNGKKVIFINAMCSEPPARATNELVFTFDGGACYFRAYWNPESKEFTDFSFNGYA